jgi:hypothetical protein
MTVTARVSSFLVGQRGACRGCATWHEQGRLQGPGATTKQQFYYCHCLAALHSHSGAASGRLLQPRRVQASRVQGLQPVPAPEGAGACSGLALPW